MASIIRKLERFNTYIEPSAGYLGTDNGFKVDGDVVISGRQEAVKELEDFEFEEVVTDDGQLKVDALMNNYASLLSLVEELHERLEDLGALEQLSQSSE